MTGRGTDAVPAVPTGLKTAGVSGVVPASMAPSAPT